MIDNFWLESSGKIELHLPTTGSLWQLPDGPQHQRYAIYQHLFAGL